MRSRPWFRHLAALIMILAVVVPIHASRPVEAQSDARYFPDSGFRVDNDALWSFYAGHGGPRAFGLPISRTFLLQGYPTQIFEVHVLTLTETGDVRVVSLLDSGWLPYGQILNRPLPKYDPSVTANAPAPDSPTYVDDMYAFVESSLPESLDGYSTRFFTVFSETVGPFPDDVDEPILLKIAALQNLDVWGIPVSRPLRDPSRAGLISVRLERGVLRFDQACGCTKPLPLGSYFKAVLTGNDLPLDLEQQAPDSPFLRQYDMETHSGPYRDWALPNTDLKYAFLPSLQYPPSNALPAPELPVMAPTSTPILRPTATPERQATATPAPTAFPAPAPLNRQPYQIVLQQSETGPETTQMSVKTGEDARSLWQTVRYERDRTPESDGLGPNVFQNTIYVARSIDRAKEVYRDQVGVKNFPEASDRFGPTFTLERPNLGEESYVLASCVEEGCNGTRYHIHLRIVFRTANIVSVFYTYGDQLSSSLNNVVPIARHVADRMVP